MTAVTASQEGVESFSDEYVSYELLANRIAAILRQAGASDAVAELLAANCAACERDGALSHGVFRVPGYVAGLQSGWVDGAAEPVVTAVGPSFVRIDAANGYAQVALAAARPEIDAALEASGVAVVAAHNSHHFSALWPDLEPFAERGFVCITMVASGAAVVLPGADHKLLGTNPFAFAAPVAGARPLIMDFATSTMSHGDLQLTALAGERVPIGTGTGRGGRDTEDPEEILEHGGLLPFGGHKGAGISIMVELLAAGLTGAAFSYCDPRPQGDTPDGPGTMSAGQILIVIDPDRGGSGFAARAAELLAALRAGGVERLPADARYAARDRAAVTGIPVTAAIAALFAE